MASWVQAHMDLGAEMKPQVLMLTRPFFPHLLPSCASALLFCLHSSAAFFQNNSTLIFFYLRNLGSLSITHLLDHMPIHLWTNHCGREAERKRERENSNWPSLSHVLNLELEGDASHTKPTELKKGEGSDTKKMRGACYSRKRAWMPSRYTCSPKLLFS